MRWLKKNQRSPNNKYHPGDLRKCTCITKLFQSGYNMVSLQAKELHLQVLLITIDMHNTIDIA